MFRLFPRYIRYSSVQRLLLFSSSGENVGIKSVTVTEPRQFTTATFPVVTTENNDNSGVAKDEDDNDDNLDSSSATKSTTTHYRNKALAEIVRQGFHSLNQVALDIQGHPGTNKSVFSPPDTGPSPRQKAEEHLILTTTTTCLENIAAKQSDNTARQLLTVNGHPIVILAVEVKKGARLAILHWALPLHILADEDAMTPRDKQILEFRMHQNLNKHGGAQMLQRAVHAALRHYYPPHLRLEPAPDEVLLKAMKDVVW